MGSIQTKEELPNRKKFHILDYGYCRVWKKKIDQVELMEEYQLCIESQQRLKAFQNIWPLRTNHSLFVNIYYFSHSQSSNLCGQLARGSVFTERIPFRLSEFANIKYPQILYLLKTCFQGYSVLYQTFGLFMVRSTMIGFTQKYEPKIWVHTDYSQPEPQNANCKTIQQMFVSIINSVQGASQYLNYPCPRFSQFIVKTNYMYFQKGFKLIIQGLQVYSKKYNISLSSNMGQIRSFVKEPEGWQKFKANNIYPRSIPSQDLIETQTTPNMKASRVSGNKFIKRQSFQSQKSDSLASTVKKQWVSNSEYKNQTNDREYLKSFLRQQQKLSSSYKKLQNNLNPPYSRIKNQTGTNQQPLKFWRSTDKVKLDIPKSNDKTPAVVAVNRLLSPPNRMSFKPPSNQYFGVGSLLNSGMVQPQRTSVVKKGGLQRNNCQSKDRFCISDKSVESSLSLIQDLQTSERLFAPYRSPRIR